MPLRVIFRPAARREYDEAYRHFESLRAGLGEEFADLADEMGVRLSQAPRLYAEVEAGVRLAILKRFSYGLIYAIEINEIVILSVFHLRRDLNAWLDDYLN